MLVIGLLILLTLGIVLAVLVLQDLAIDVLHLLVLFYLVVLFYFVVLI